MATLSYIDTSVKKADDVSAQIPTDESVGAMLFDISGFKDVFDGYSLLYNSFKDNQVQCIKNMDDAQLVGIEDNDFLNGVLYYHISQFYQFLDANQTLYVVLADCSQSWDVIQSIQQQANGKVFQVGIWTSQSIWQMQPDNTLGFTSLITDLQVQADEVNGKIGESAHSMVPLSIILCGNTYYAGGDFTYKNLPNAIDLNCPKVSVAVLQNGSEQVKAMQKKNPNQAPVSALGLIMACLATCGAEESIASISKCDLNKNEDFNQPEWGIGKTGTPIDTVHRIWANIISGRGYIIPIDCEGMEASYFLSSDTTLSEGDYCTIANNRVMHKCRRAVATVLIPYVHGNYLYDYSSGNINSSAIAIITDSIYTILDSVMRNRKGQQQIEGRVVTFVANNNMLEDDTMYLKLDIKPASYSGYISEGVSHDV